MSKPLIVLAAAVSAAALLPLSASPAATGGSFALDSRSDAKSSTMLDAKPRGESAGDVNVFSTSLTRGGRPAGRAEYIQTLVDNRYRGISNRVDLLLEDGTLELQGAALEVRPPGGAKPGPEADLAIIGGTGAYAGARGTVRVTDTSQTNQRLTVTLMD